MAKAGELTEKMEAYCQARTDKNNTRLKCYRIAYPKALKWTDNSASVEASNLESNPKIILRIKELNNLIMKDSAWTRSKSVRILARIAAKLDNVHDRDIINSIKELNNMHGFNEPTKIENTIKSAPALNINIVSATKKEDPEQEIQA